MASRSVGPRAEKQPPGVEAVVLNKMADLSLNTPFELFKLIAWVHTLKEASSRQKCLDLIRAQFVEPYAMSHDSYEYGRALELSGALDDPRDAFVALREYVFREFAHRAGSSEATSDWEAKHLLQGLERVVKEREVSEPEPVSRGLPSGERPVSRVRPAEGDLLNETDELGAAVSARAKQAYDSFVKGSRSKRSAA